MDFVHLNGELVKREKARLSPEDQGLLVGHGVFETIRVEKGIPFAFRYHWERLADACRRLDLSIPAKDHFESAIHDLIQGNETRDARLRLTVTGGEAPFLEIAKQPTVLMTLAPLPKVKKSAVVVTCPFTRNERGALAGIKSISYGENLLALRHAKEMGADEAILRNTKGELCEGATTNLFVIRDHQIYTTHLDSGCLPGTTRRIVLELCDALDIPFRESRLPREFDFAFLTSSIRGLQPIERFDDLALPTEHELFAKLDEGYRNFQCG